MNETKEDYRIWKNENFVIEATIAISLWDEMLINDFYKISGCPVIVNTSFNIRGEPIVCSIDDAYRCFMGTNLDVLVCENYVMFKEEQNTNLLKEYKTQFELD